MFYYLFQQMHIAHLNRQRNQSFASWARELLEDTTIPDERVFPALRRIFVCTMDN